MKIGKLLGIVILILISASCVFSVGTTPDNDNTVAYYEFENDVLDNLGNYNGTDSGTTDTASGKINRARLFSSGDSVQLGDTTELEGTAHFTVGGWYYPTDLTPQTGFWGYGTVTNDLIGLWTSGTTAYVMVNNGANQYATFSESLFTLNTWQSVYMVYNGSASTDAERLKVYINNVSITLTYTLAVPATTSATMSDFRIGQYQQSSSNYIGIIDEFVLFNYSLGHDEINYLHQEGTPGDEQQWEFGTVVPGSGNDSVESTAVVKQLIPIDVNTPALTTIISTTYNITQNDTQLYGVYNFNVLANQNNNIYCELQIDSVQVANATRTNILGELGSMSLMSQHFSQDEGEHTQELACAKIGAGKVTISNAIGIGHIMLDEDGNTLNHDSINSTTTVSSGNSFTNIGQLNFTISNETVVNRTKYLVLEWSANYINLGADEILSTYINVNGTNCSFYPRDVTGPSVGSVAGDCLIKNVTTNATYEINVFGNGTNSEYNMNLIAKEFVLSPGEIDGGAGLLVGSNFSDNSNTKLVTIEGGNINHAITNVFQKQAYSILTDKDTIVDMYIELNNTVDLRTVHMSRFFSAGEVGVLIGHDVFENVPQDDYNISVFANCGTDGANCTIVGGAGIGYITDVTTTLFNGFYISAYDLWDNESLLNISAVNGATFSTTVGNITYFTEEDFINFTLTSNNGNGYYNITFENYNTSNNLNTSMYQTIINIISEEISTKNAITNWTLITENGEYTTTNGTVTIYPKIGTYIWNWTNLEQYFNITDISFTINSIYDNITISNLFARNITFTDSISGATITPECGQNGYTYSNYYYLMHKSVDDVICNLFGYNTSILTLVGMPDSSNYEMTPVALMINFSEKVSGIIQAGDTYINEFNATNISIPQANITEDYVKITFNPDASGKYQQIFSYYNDLNTTISENILIQEVDLQQNVKITGDTQALINARVCSRYPNNETYWTTYCDFTNSVGEVIIQVNDQNTYLLCVQAEGYEPKCELHYIPATNQETITINLISTDLKEGTNYISSTCRGVYTEDENCILDIVTYKPYYSICLNITKTIGNISNETITCSYNSIAETFLYSLSQTYNNYTLGIYLDGELAKELIHINATKTTENEVSFTSGNNNGSTILERIKDDIELYIAIHILLLVMAVFSGYVMEKYFNGYGVYGAGIWFLFLGVAQFYVFYIPATIIGGRFIMEKIMPLFNN